jgi:hypothetical protein
MSPKSKVQSPGLGRDLEEKGPKKSLQGWVEMICSRALYSTIGLLWLEFVN